MRVGNRNNKTKNWIRYALKIGLLATDATVLTSIGRMLSERYDAHDVLRPRERLAAELGNRTGWSHTSTLLTGVGIGIGLGMLFAPVSGQEARSTIRDKAVGVREKMSDAAAWAGLGPQSESRRQSTGTYAD